MDDIKPTNEIPSDTPQQTPQPKAENVTPKQEYDVPPVKSHWVRNFNSMPEGLDNNKK